MTAIPAGERKSHHELSGRLMSEALQEIREASDGIALRFQAEEYDAVARFVALERLCCPFLDFVLEVNRDRGPLWLRLSGAPGAKEFIRAELRLPAHSSLPSAK